MHIAICLGTTNSSENLAHKKTQDVRLCWLPGLIICMRKPAAVIAN